MGGPPPHTPAAAHCLRAADVETASGSVFRVYHHGDLPSQLPAGQPEAIPVLIFLHGAGATGLSFALSAGELVRLATGGTSSSSFSSSSSGSSGSSTTTTNNNTSSRGPLILCPDLPFHGQTRAIPDDADWSAGRLVAEVLWCLSACLTPRGDGHARPKYSLTLIGHSLGGALVVRLAADPGLAALGELKGVCIVEMVEAAALENLDGMRARVESIPQCFDSIDAAVRWSLQAGFLRNEASAEISLPSQLRAVQRSEGGRPELVWIVRLLETEAHWRGWFLGMSDSFLALAVPKLLVLANYAMLDCDRALTAAQMQGRFQLDIIQGGTHNLHEDHPDAFARTIFRFLCRNKILQPPDVAFGLGSSSNSGGGGGGGGGSSRGPSPCPSPSPHRPHSRSAPPSPSPSPSPPPPPPASPRLWPTG